MSRQNRAILPGGGALDTADVPTVTAHEMSAAIDHLVDAGQGLAFLKGLDEESLADLENALWRLWPDAPERRLAVMLRFRAALAVFGARRLRNLLLTRGYRVVRASAEIAASARLNVRFGFRVQSFFAALDDATRPIEIAPFRTFDSAMAA